MTFRTFARISCRGVLLAAFITAATGPAMADSHAVSPAQKRAIEQVVRDYLLANPEILLDAIQALRKKQAAEAEKRTQTALISLRDELENDPTSPVGGNPKGDVTIVEFFDYRCAFCKRVFPAIKKLVREDGNIRYVYKEFPILGPQSKMASRAALASWVLNKEKYEAFHSALMQTKGALGEKRIMRIAADTGLNVARLRTGMADAGISGVLDRNFALARALNINGTPAFVIGDKVIPGAIDFDALKKLVAEARNG